MLIFLHAFHLYAMPTLPSVWESRTGYYYDCLEKAQGLFLSSCELCNDFTIHNDNNNNNNNKKKNRESRERSTKGKTLGIK